MRHSVKSSFVHELNLFNEGDGRIYDNAFGLELKKTSNLPFFKSPAVTPLSANLKTKKAVLVVLAERSKR